MNEHLERAHGSLTEELEALDRRRLIVVQALDSLTALIGGAPKAPSPTPYVAGINERYDKAFKDDAALLAALKEPIKLADLAKQLKANRPKLKKTLVRLKDAGLVVVAGRASAATWQASKKGAATPRGNL